MIKIADKCSLPILMEHTFLCKIMFNDLYILIIKAVGLIIRLNTVYFSVLRFGDAIMSPNISG